MTPIGFVRKGKWARILSATVLCSVVSVAYGGTIMLEQTPAQDRMFESLFGGGGGWQSAPAPPPHGGPPMNLPDVAGFGMYPLWKFHKFDGLSLRPVPYGVDIGSGIPPSPIPPAYPTGFLPSAAPQTPAAPYYNAPAPATAPQINYEAAPSTNTPQTYQAPPPAQQSYNNPPPQQAAPPQNYGNQDPQQNYRNPPPSYGITASYAPESANSYQPINLSYQQVPQAPKYNEPAPSYSAPAAPSYEPQPYMQQPNNYPMNSAPSGYDSVQYGSGNNGVISFSAAPQDYQMQQQQQPMSMNYGSPAAGSYQMPTYSSIESPMSVSYPSLMDSKPMHMDGYSSGGFLKRSSSSFAPENNLPKKAEGETGNPTT